MDRKVSSTSEQSHTSSVVIQPHLQGLGKQTIENIISTSNNNQDSSLFNTQEIYDKRQQNSNKFIVSTFDNNYNDHNLKYHSQHSLDDKQEKPLSISPPQHQQHQRVEEEQDDEDDEFDETIDLDKSISDIIDVELGDQYEEQLDDDTFDEHNNEQQQQQQQQQPYPQDEDEELMNYLDNDYEPASPPRSPPRDLDTDKLYGLYEFSGPDPSHCSLQVDEPVYLINDQDSYWWLIKKLSKHEKMERFKRIDLNHFDVESDDEDGKVGFVPAECLETYGERLARLNCFKNEELEKLIPSREDSIVSVNKKSPSNSSSTTNTVAKKSVTFENLGDIIDEYSDEEPKDDHENIRQNLQFYNDLGAIKPLSTSNQDHEQPEVLSDVYPVDAPLFIPKNNTSKNIINPQTQTQAPSSNQPNTTSATVTPTFHSSDVFEDLFVKPRPQNSTKEYDDISIGSYSPDTPVKGKSPLRSEIGDTRHVDADDEDEDDQMDRNSSLTSLRRSVILDRLTKVTSDIQEQLLLDGIEDDDEDEEEEEEDFNHGTHPLQKSVIGATIESSTSDIEDEQKGQEFSFATSLDSSGQSSNHSLDKSKQDEVEGLKQQKQQQQQESDFVKFTGTPERGHDESLLSNHSQEQKEQSPLSNHSHQSPLSNHSQQSPLSNHSHQSPLSNHSQQSPLSNHSRQSPLSNHSQQSTMSNHSQQSTLSNNSQESPICNQAQHSVTSTPIQVERTPTLEDIKRIPSQDRVKSTPIEVKRTRTPDYDKHTPRQDHGKETPTQADRTFTPVQINGTSTPDHLNRTPSQDHGRRTPLGSNNASKEDTQFTPTHRSILQQGNNISPSLQKLLDTPSFSQPPVSQIPTPNSLRSPPNQSYSISNLSYNQLPKSNTSIGCEDEEEQSSSEENNNDDSITPLTSMNSLTPIDERRKSKPVHEMFMPILGKFDELAEKLAELDDILK